MDFERNIALARRTLQALCPNCPETCLYLIHDIRTRVTTPFVPFVSRRRWLCYNHAPDWLGVWCLFLILWSGHCIPIFVYLKTLHVIVFFCVFVFAFVFVFVVEARWCGAGAHSWLSDQPFLPEHRAVRNATQAALGEEARHITPLIAN